MELNKKLSVLSMAVCLILFSCKNITLQEKADVSVNIDPKTIVSEGYVGNGVQWDPYALDYGSGPVEISDADWAKLYSRLDFMRPAFIRVMMNTRDCVKDGKLYPEIGLGRMSHILDYCQSRNVTVALGDWGGALVDAKSDFINFPLLDKAVEFVDYLVNEKGYDCIKYYNLINEPNGFWSVTEGNQNLWIGAAVYFKDCMKACGLLDKVTIIGPDVAIWTADYVDWIDRTKDELQEAVGLYDIHTYPSKITVNSGAYSEILKAYKEKVPSSHKIVMGEIGLKFVEKADSSYLTENNRRIEAYPNASRTDSQMFVYDYMYGTDMADVLFQTVNAGYSGCVAWMLDDAMHYNESKDKLKIWGFWNILGEEIFGKEQENVRPWFYAWSLMCRYIPAGSAVYKVSVAGDSGVRAIASVCGGKRTVALLNVSEESKTVYIKSSDLGKLRNTARFVYGDGLFSVEGDCNMLPDAVGVKFNSDKGELVTLAPESIYLITELDN